MYITTYQQIDDELNLKQDKHKILAKKSVSFVLRNNYHLQKKKFAKNLSSLRNCNNQKMQMQVQEGEKINEISLNKAIRYRNIRLRGYRKDQNQEVRNIKLNNQQIDAVKCDKIQNQSSGLEKDRQYRQLYKQIATTKRLLNSQNVFIEGVSALKKSYITKQSDKNTRCPIYVLDLSNRKGPSSKFNNKQTNLDAYRQEWGFWGSSRQELRLGGQTAPPSSSSPPHSLAKQYRRLMTGDRKRSHNSRNLKSAGYKQSAGCKNSTANCDQLNRRHSKMLNENIKPWVVPSCDDQQFIF